MGVRHLQEFERVKELAESKEIKLEDLVPLPTILKLITLELPLHGQIFMQDVLIHRVEALVYAYDLKLRMQTAMINYDTSYASFIVCMGFMQGADIALWDNNNYRLAIENWNKEHQKT